MYDKKKRTSVKEKTNRPKSQSAESTQWAPGYRHCRGKAVHKAALGQLRAQIGTDFGEVRRQTAEKQKVCPCCQSAVIEEAFNSSLDKFICNKQVTRKNKYKLCSCV